MLQKQDGVCKNRSMKNQKRTFRADRLLLVITTCVLLLILFGSAITLLFGQIHFGRSEGDSGSQDPNSVLITAAGDILLEEPMLNYFGSGGWQGYMDKLSPWFGKDAMTIANLEVPVGGEALGVSGIDFSFNAPAQTAQNVRDAGIDFVSLANNHAMDRGFEGIVNTHANLDAAGIPYTGTFTDEQSRDILCVQEIGGMRIGIVSFTYNCNQPIDQSWYVNAYYSAWDDRSDLLIADIRAARAQTDAVIVCIHWGNEFTYQINSEQQVLAQAIADAGADVIIGNHPHCIQPAQWLTAADGRQVLCFYSLGNLVSSAYQVDRASETFQNMYEVGMIAQFSLVRAAGTGQSVTVQNPQIIPVVNHFENEYQNYQLIPLKDYTEDMAAKHDQARYSSLFSADWLKQQIYSVLSESGIPIELGSFTPQAAVPAAHIQPSQNTGNSSGASDQNSSSSSYDESYDGWSAYDESYDEDSSYYDSYGYGYDDGSYWQDESVWE